MRQKIALNLAYNNYKLNKTLNIWSRDILNFEFSGKGLGIVSPSHFANDFSRKIFLILHYIFFKSNLGFCLELGLLNSETKVGTGVA